MSNNYEEVIIFVHEHYKDGKDTHNMLLAIEDQQQATRIHPRLVRDFSRNENPAYWCNKLQNKENLLKECRRRGLDPKELWRLPNKQIASVLISHDKTKVVIHK